MRSPCWVRTSVACSIALIASRRAWTVRSISWASSGRGSTHPVIASICATKPTRSATTAAVVRAAATASRGGSRWSFNGLRALRLQDGRGRGGRRGPPLSAPISSGFAISRAPDCSAARLFWRSRAGSLKSCSETPYPRSGGFRRSCAQAEGGPWQPAKA